MNHYLPTWIYIISLLLTHCIPIHREIFIVQESMLCLPKLICSLNTAHLRVVDNDTGLELPEIFFRVAPYVFKRNIVSISLSHSLSLSISISLSLYFLSPCTSPLPLPIIFTNLLPTSSSSGWLYIPCGGEISSGCWSAKR